MARILNWLYWHEGITYWEDLKDGQSFSLGSEVYIAIAWVDGITGHLNLTVRRRGLFFLKDECEATMNQDTYASPRSGKYVVFNPIPFPLPRLPGAFILDVTLTETGKTEVLAIESRKVNVRAINLQN